MRSFVLVFSIHHDDIDTEYLVVENLCCLRTSATCNISPNLLRLHQSDASPDKPSNYQKRALDFFQGWARTHYAASDFCGVGVIS